MITDQGKTFIKRYLAGQSGAAIGAISLGIDSTPAALGDKRLGFEFVRFPVSLIAYDYSRDKLVFKGTLPDDSVGIAYEAGLWTSEVNAFAGDGGSGVITSFDSETEEWLDTVTYSNVSRIGGDALKHTPGANNTLSSKMVDLVLDLSAHSNADEFVFAFSSDNTNCQTISLKMGVDESNYYEFIVTDPGAGYFINSFTKGSAAATGAPDWDEINEISVATTAKAGGSASVTFDGIRIEDVDAVAPDYGLISRYVLPTPFTKSEGSVLDLEYTIDITA